jgi:hypothetical protein
MEATALGMWVLPPAPGHHRVNMSFAATQMNADLRFSVSNATDAALRIFAVFGKTFELLDDPLAIHPRWRFCGFDRPAIGTHENQAEAKRFHPGTPQFEWRRRSVAVRESARRGYCYGNWFRPDELVQFRAGQPMCHFAP